MEQTTQHKIQKIKIGITHGDINGIGYEIILKAFKDPRMLEFFTPIIYGSPKVAAYYKKVLKLSQVQLNHIKNADKADPDTVNIINCVDNKVRVEIGRPTEISGKAALDALTAAVNDLKAGKLDALITAPISKEAIYSENFQFKGHTHYLAQQWDADVLMMMIYENLRIAVVTDHIPLKQVADTLNTELIISSLKIMEQSLKIDFSIEKPKIAVLSLNPHASDNGLIGDEEEKIIKPAIEQAKEQGMVVLGPYPADGFFASGNYKNFDGILAMYHDQGMLPFKIISKGQGVNYTAGLPIIRTSPDHGTAYDIAGLNEADPASFINALFLARDIYKNRKRFEGIAPLEKQNMEELLPTLIPAKAAELEEMASIQQEDEQDNVQQTQTPSTDKNTEQPKQQTQAQPAEQVQETTSEQTQLQEQTETTTQTETSEEPEPEPEQQPEQPQQEIITGDHPDVEIETIDEPGSDEPLQNNNAQTENDEEKESKHQGLNKLKEKLHPHKQKDKQHEKHREHKRHFKLNPKDYRDLT